MPNGRRQAALRTRLAAEGLDALLVSGSANIRYLTGFTGSAGQLLVGHGGTVLVTDFRYATQAAAEVGTTAEVRIEKTSVWDGVRAALAAAGIARAGVDRDRTTLADSEQLDRAAGVTWVRTRGFVEDLRVAKEPAEVAAVRAAATLAAEALEATLGTIRPGVTELEVATELEAALRRRGSEWHPFQPIVASGPRSALPHARAGPRRIEPGDFLVIDFGAQVGGYCSDLTRTFVVGAKATSRQRQIYDLVRSAQARAIGSIRAGMTGKAADSLGRDPIAEAGLGDGFGHSLGHGLGLEVHEAPRLSQLNTNPLPVGAVVTIEPGVYLEGWGGVRLEDDVLLLETGAECLSDGRTNLVELT
ncbi:MAG: M24 family metallopeptidase [Gemmatimonadales bacterium]